MTANPVRGPSRAFQSFLHLSDPLSVPTSRHLASEPGGVGYLSTLASPLDPAFFLMHAIFNKVR